MDLSKLEKMQAEDLVALSEKDTSDFRWNRFQIYNIAFKKFESQGNEDRMEDMRKEVTIFLLSTRNRSGKRFGPMWSLKYENGAEQSFPDPDNNIKKDALDYYRKRASVTENPILRSRYCDVIWEQEKDVAFAKMAITSYIDCCPIYLENEWDGELADSLGRIMTLSISINDIRLIEESLKHHYEFIDLLIKKERPRYIIEIIESILKSVKKISQPVDYEKLALAIEGAILHYSENKPDSFHLQRGYMGLLVKIWQIQKKQEEVDNSKIRIAGSYVKEAEWKRTNYPNGNIVAAHFYEEAMKKYIEMGKFPEQVEELKTKIQEANKAAHKEYKVISSEVNFPQEELDKYLKLYGGLKSIEVFQQISMDPFLIPSYSASKDLAIKISEECVARHLMPISLQKGNITIKRISGEDEKLELQTIQNFQMSYNVNTKIRMSQLFSLLEKEHPGYMDALIQHLSNSQLINPERIDLIKCGLQSFEKMDYVAANHILVFQIEGVLRDILAKIGLPTFSYRNNEMREKLLSAILEILGQVKGINEDLLKFIEILLCDIRGDNFRNDVAHGLLKINAFSREQALLLILILIKIASYNIVKQDKGTDDSNSSNVGKSSDNNGTEETS